MSLYSNARGKVRTEWGLSQSFPFQRGVLQGESASPYLFNFLINGIVQELEDGPALPIRIGKTKFHILLFCDDIAIVAHTPHQLQNKIDTAAKFFNQVGLKVNISKTNVVVYSKKKPKDFNKYEWKWDGAKLEIKNAYVYLGVPLPSSLNFSTTVKSFTTKGQAACVKVKEIVHRSGVPLISTHVKLFNSIARSTLMYASPLWALKHTEEVDKVQNQFFKNVLRLPKSAPGYFVRSECGVQKVSLQILKDTLGFIARTLARDDDAPVKQCLLQQFQWCQEAKTKMEMKYCWMYKVKKLLQQVGEETILKITDHRNFYNVRERVVNKYAEFLQNDDNRRIQSSSYIPHYPSVKSTNCRENYFNNNLSPPTSRLIAQLRLNKCSVKVGYVYIKLGSKCMLCTSNNETSVEHFMFECYQLRHEYNNLIKPFLSFDSLNSSKELKYVDIFSRENFDKKMIKSLSLFWFCVAKMIDLCE
jgi:hypothetical protein